MTAEMTQKSSVNVKAIALPVQHGGWGFWFEPTLAGLLLAFSFPGLGLGIAGLMVLLLHQPLRVYLKDIRKGKRYERTKVAERFVGLYAGIWLLASLLSLVNAPDMRFLLPLIAALPLAGIQLWYELKNKGRDLLPEISGAVMFGAIAPCIVLLADWDLSAALALWVALAVRAVPSIFYVRARLRLEHGKPVSVFPALLAHILGFIFLLVMVAVNLLPVITLAAGIILAARAMVGLSRYRRSRPAKVIGFQEIGVGILVVCLIVVGY